MVHVPPRLSFRALVMLLMGVALACGGQGAEQAKGGEDAGMPAKRKKTALTPMERPGNEFTLTSPTIKHRGTIPSRHTCDGEGLSPQLDWTDPPAGTQSLALVVDDPDAPGQTFVHWVIYDMPVGARSLKEGLPSDPILADPQGVKQGRNDFGKTGWGGPCPPAGKSHRYVFRLYALDTVLGLDPGATRIDAERAMKGHMLGQSGVIATYARPG